MCAEERRLRGAPVAGTSVQREPILHPDVEGSSQVTSFCEGETVPWRFEALNKQGSIYSREPGWLTATTDTFTLRQVLRATGGDVGVFVTDGFDQVFPWARSIQEYTPNPPSLLDCVLYIV